MLLTLLSLCLLLLGEQAAAQQCGLAKPQDAAEHLGAPPAAVSPRPNQTTNDAPSTTVPPSQGDSSAGGYPAPTPFSYGTKPIRGVNL